MKRAVADEATLAARRSLMQQLPVGAVFDLRSTYLGNDEVSRLDYLSSRGTSLIQCKPHEPCPKALADGAAGDHPESFH